MMPLISCWAMGGTNGSIFRIGSRSNVLVFLWKVAAVNTLSKFFLAPCRQESQNPFPAPEICLPYLHFNYSLGTMPCRLSWLLQYLDCWLSSIKHRFGGLTKKISNNNSKQHCFMELIKDYLRDANLPSPLSNLFQQSC